MFQIIHQRSWVPTQLGCQPQSLPIPLYKESYSQPYPSLPAVSITQWCNFSLFHSKSFSENSWIGTGGGVAQWVKCLLQVWVPKCGSPELIWKPGRTTCTCNHSTEEIDSRSWVLCVQMVKTKLWAPGSVKDPASESKVESRRHSILPFTGACP